MTAKFKSDTYSSCLQSVLDEYRKTERVDIKPVLVMEDFASSADFHRERLCEEFERVMSYATDRLAGVMNDGHLHNDISGGLSYVLDSIRNHEAGLTNSVKTINALLQAVFGTASVLKYTETLEAALNAEAAQRRQDSATKKSTPLYAVKASS